MRAAARTMGLVLNVKKENSDPDYYENDFAVPKSASSGHTSSHGDHCDDPSDGTTCTNGRPTDKQKETYLCEESVNSPSPTGGTEDPELSTTPSFSRNELNFALELRRNLTTSAKDAVPRPSPDEQTEQDGDKSPPSMTSKSATTFKSKFWSKLKMPCKFKFPFIRADSHDEDPMPDFLANEIRYFGTPPLSRGIWISLCNFLMLSLRLMFVERAVPFSRNKWFKKKCKKTTSFSKLSLFVIHVMMADRALLLFLKRAFKKHAKEPESEPDSSRLQNA